MQLAPISLAAAFPAYVHTSAFIIDPEPDCDAMDDAEYARAGGSNRLRTEIEAEAIGAELISGGKVANLDARLDRLEALARAFADEDPESAAEINAVVLGRGVLHATLLDTAIFLRQLAAATGSKTRCTCGFHSAV